MTAREPNKQAIHIRLDSDIINFFKTHSKHYQTKINGVLRAYILAFERMKYIQKPAK